MPDKIPHKETLTKYNDDNKHLEEQEQARCTANKVWELMTPTEIGDYLIRKDYLYEEDDFLKRIMSSTNLDFNTIDDAISYLRNDSARLDEWTSSEEGSAWLEANESNTDTDDDEYDDENYDDNDENYDDDDEENQSK